MPGLGDTVSNLPSLRRVEDLIGKSAAVSTRLRPLTPTGSNPGNLRGWFHAPPGLPPGAPLVVVLHGCTQTAAFYDRGSGWSTLADRHGFALLFAEQDRANNGALCFNWFRHEDAVRDGGEALSIRQMIGQMIMRLGLNPGRVYITGLSAGGAMTSVMLATYPEIFAGGAIIAGLPYGAAAGMQQALQAMTQVRHRTAKEWGDLVRAASPHRGPWPHVQVWQGDADATVREGNAEEILKQWADVHGISGPPVTDTVDGALHAAWRSPAGAVVLESYLIHGLAHGTPLHTKAEDFDQSMGFVAPHMLEAGISSTWRIARSWGLLTQAASPRLPAPARPASAKAPPLMAKVGGIIEHALRSAGL